MYKNANKNQQFAVSRIDIAEMEKGSPSISEEGRRSSIARKLNAVMEEIRNTPKGAKRRALGQRQFELQQQISAIRPAKKAPGVGQYFMDAARDLLTKAMFNIVMGEAAKRLKAAQEKEAANEPE